MTYVLYIYMCILSVELVHAIRSCSSSIHSETVVASTLCGPPPARVAIDRPGSRLQQYAPLVLNLLLVCCIYCTYVGSEHSLSYP